MRKDLLINELQPEPAHVLYWRVRILLNGNLYLVTEKLTDEAVAVNTARCLSIRFDDPDFKVVLLRFEADAVHDGKELGLSVSVQPLTKRENER